jgi:hypothetical protein
MKRLALIVVLGLLAGTTHGTFELEDPAAQIFEDLQASRDRQAMQTLEKNTFCAINTDTKECYCIHKETGQMISLAHDECMSRVSKSSKIQEP